VSSGEARDHATAAEAEIKAGKWRGPRLTTKVRPRPVSQE
jgi:hypothetical protein